VLPTARTIVSAPTASTVQARNIVGVYLLIVGIGKL